MERSRIYNKISQIASQDNMEIRGSKVVIPMDRLSFFLEIEHLVKLMIGWYVRKGVMPQNTGTSLKKSVDKTNYSKIMDRHKLSSHGSYTNLKDVCIYAGGHIKLSAIFEKFMHQYGGADEQTYRLRLEEFFKYMPYLNDLHKNSLILTDFCCEDHDGPYDEFVSGRVDAAVRGIKQRLDKLYINYDK